MLERLTPFPRGDEQVDARHLLKLAFERLEHLAVEHNCSVGEIFAVARPPVVGQSFFGLAAGDTLSAQDFARSDKNRPFSEIPTSRPGIEQERSLESVVFLEEVAHAAGLPLALPADTDDGNIRKV